MSISCSSSFYDQTDDTLPFRTSLEGEYALLMAAPPLGLGLSEEEVKVIGEMSMDARFADFHEVH